MTDKSHSRGYYGESRIAKKVKGKIVGRSKAILLPSGKVIEIDHQHPPDSINSLFAFESKYRRHFPKAISEAMLQAETNASLCKPELIPVLVVKDPYRKVYYYCLRERDFCDLLVGDKQTGGYSLP